MIGRISQLSGSAHLWALARRACAVGASILAISAPLGAAPPVQAFTSIPQNRLLSGQEPIVNASPVFLSDSEIAVLVESGTLLRHASTLVKLRLEGSSLRRVASANVPSQEDEVFAASAGRLIVLDEFVPGELLFGADLGAPEVIPFPLYPFPSPRVGVIGDSTTSSWRVFRLGDLKSPVRTGSGFLYSVTDSNLVYGTGSSIRVETLAGRLVDSFPNPSTNWGDFDMEAAGPARLLVRDFRGDLSIVFLGTHGRESLRLHPPEGWGFRYGWSDSGARIMFDNFTRTVPMIDRVGDFFSKLLGAPEQPNGESLEVEDTTTGGICFALDSPWKLFGLEGSNHSDLSPSGRLLVVSTLTELSVYRLPEVCNLK